MKKQSRWVAPILRQKHLTCFYIHTNEVSGEQVDVGPAVNYRNNPNPLSLERQDLNLKKRMSTIIINLYILLSNLNWLHVFIIF